MLQLGNKYGNDKYVIVLVAVISWHNQSRLIPVNPMPYFVQDPSLSTENPRSAPEHVFIHLVLPCNVGLYI